ncbi:MAG: helix-turn-helix domain-containing protein [Synergistaceae bacterium]|nr:helix-turn-helix domain-containing protein [Synergistaceae bacterium]
MKGNNQEAETLRTKKDFWFACVDIDVLRDKELSQSARFIFAVLCTFITLNNRNCWPSNDTVADAAGVSKSTVKRAYQELEARGVIARSDRFNEDSSQTSSYTRIVGHNAVCYEGGAPMNPSQSIDDLPPGSQVNHKGNQVKDIITLTGEADLPDSPRLEKTNEDKTVTEPQENSKPEERFTLKDAPDIMRQTAELLLLKTGRKFLAWEEILALRELSASQMPARVQKEIDRACERFARQGKPLGSLRFEYIASALQSQPTRGKKAKNKYQPEGNPQEVRTCTDEQAEAEMARIAELQAKFDRAGRYSDERGISV